MEQKDRPDNLELVELQQELNQVGEEELPVSQVGYVVVTVVCALLMAAAVGILHVFGFGMILMVQTCFLILIAAFIYMVFCLKPSTKEAEALLKLGSTALKLDAVLDIKVVMYQYSKTTYYNFTFKNKELGYKTKVTASKLSYEARELLESPLEGDDCKIDKLSNQVEMKNVMLIANPEDQKHKALVLLIWRGHRIWCRADKNFSLEALEYKDNKAVRRMVLDETSRDADQVLDRQNSGEEVKPVQNGKQLKETLSRRESAELSTAGSELVKANPVVTCSLMTLYLVTGMSIGVLLISVIWHQPLLGLLTKPSMVGFLACFLIGSMIGVVRVYMMEASPPQFGVTRPNIRLKLPLILVLVPLFMVLAHYMNMIK